MKLNTFFGAFLSTIALVSAANLRQRAPSSDDITAKQPESNVQSEDNIDRVLQSVDSSNDVIQEIQDRIITTFRRRNQYKEGDRISISLENVTFKAGSVKLVGQTKRERGQQKIVRTYDEFNRNNNQRRTTLNFQNSFNVPRKFKAQVTKGLSYRRGDIQALIRIIPSGGSGNQPRVDFSLSKTSPTTSSQPRRVSYDFKGINLPPRTRAEIIASYNQFNYSSRFNSVIEINSTGRITVIITDSKGNSKTHRITLRDALRPQNGGGYSTGKSNNQVLFTARGQLDWTTSSSIRLGVNYYKLDQRSTTPFKQEVSHQDI